MTRSNSKILFALCLLMLLSTAGMTQGLSSSLFHSDRSGLSRSWRIFEQTGKGRVAFMGGSITEAPGWRDSVCRFLQVRFPKTKFEFINAGISSTGSTPGAFRFGRDVIAQGSVDLFFEEAAVNDPTNGFSAVYQVRGMEGIIRQAPMSNPNMDIVVMHFADPDKLSSYEKGLIPEVIEQHEKVADHYQVNSINLAKEVYARIAAREFTWAGDFKDLHPSPFGHGVYARSIISFMNRAFDQASAREIAQRRIPPPLDPASYDMGYYGDIREAVDLNGFNLISSWKPIDGAPTRKRYVSVPVLEGLTPGASLSFSFTGKAIGLCITSGPDAGNVEYEIDGKWKGMKSLHTKWSQSLHLPWYVILEDQLPPGQHVLKLRIASLRDDKSKGYAVRIHHFLVNGPRD
jgi:sialidase-1